MSKGIIFDIKRFSIHDGPGIRTTIFLKGCPLHCLWCHNPESQSPHPQIMLYQNRCITCESCLGACPEHAISRNGFSMITDRELCKECGVCVDYCLAEARQVVGEEMSVAEVMTAIQKDLAFYDESGGGVTFSGGEPLVQKNFLLDVVKACHEQEIHTAVDTSGAVSWKSIEQVMPYVDLFLYDLKCMDEQKHQEYTGVSNQLILENLRRLSTSGAKINLRLAVIPGVNDDQENIERTAEFATNLPNLSLVSILPFHETSADKYRRIGREYWALGLKSPSESQLAAIARVFEEHNLKTNIRG